MDNCKNHEKNKEMCNCTYSSCSKKYTCCECMHYHRKMGDLPACYFSAKAEATFDRSIENFIRTRS